MGQLSVEKRARLLKGPHKRHLERILNRFGKVPVDRPMSPHVEETLTLMEEEGIIEKKIESVIVETEYWVLKNPKKDKDIDPHA